MNGVDHLGFIVAAYASTIMILLGTVAALLLDARAQKKLLGRYEAGRSGEVS